MAYMYIKKTRQMHQTWCMVWGDEQVTHRLWNIIFYILKHNNSNVTTYCNQMKDMKYIMQCYYFLNKNT